MKGSVNIEFIISVFVFLTTISFITVTIINNVPVFRYISVSEINNAKAYSISEILLFDEGYPKSGNVWWTRSSSLTDVADIQRIGLSNGTNYVLSTDKINALGNICSNNYNFIRNVFGADVIIQIYYIDDVSNPLVNCPSRRSNTASEFSLTRFSITDQNKIVGLKIGTYV